MARLFSSDDPYGAALARRTMLWFALAVVVIGALRVVSLRDPFLPFVLIAAGVAGLALVLEPMFRLLVKR